MGKAWDVLTPRNLELGPLAGHERAGSPWRNWLLARDDDGIAWLALDKANASANTLSEDVLAELNDLLAHLERDIPKGLVLRSAKPKGFIAGADIGEFRGMTDAAAVAAALTWRSGTTASTRPSDLARRARALRPVSIMVMASSGLISRRRRTVPPSPGCRPSMTSGNPSDASSTAMR